MKRDGFTLIEFIVIMSIFTIMASVALFNFQGFRSNVAVNNLAHDTALLLRQAQTFGWSGLTDTSIQTVEQGIIQRFAHGVFFKYDGSGFSKDLLLYKKIDSKPGKEFYSQNDEITDIISVTGSYKIISIATAAEKSDLLLDQDKDIPTSGIQQNQDISIAFTRPNPQALLFLDNNGIPLSQQYLAIYIGQEDQIRKAEKVIIVSRSGEIFVE